MPEETPEKTRHQIHVEAMRRKEQATAELLEKKRRAEAKVRSALDVVARTHAGEDLLIWLFHLCGYNESSIVIDTASGEILERASEHNEARRSVYLDIRKKMDPELRARIELLAEKPFDATPTK